MKNKITAVVVAAGKSQRLKVNIPKPYIKIVNVPILIYTLKNLEKSPEINEIILVVQKGFLKQTEYLIRKFNLKKLKKIVPGGDLRQESVANGLKEVGRDADFVLIHDGVRPFIDEQMIRRSISAAKKFGAAICAVPATPTLKSSNRSNFVEQTLDREKIWFVQTPQVFKRDIIQKAHRLAKRANINGTDDAYLVERLGKKVKIVLGSYRNIKITTKEDLIIAKAMIRKNKG